MEQCINLLTAKNNWLLIQGHKDKQTWVYAKNLAEMNMLPPFKAAETASKKNKWKMMKKWNDKQLTSTKLKKRTDNFKQKNTQAGMYVYMCVNTCM